ncbi:MAG: OmpA family protein [Phycisphaerales bacterium]|nr:OmpA family protein [Phycisphaerales bacterium]
MIGQDVNVLKIGARLLGLGVLAAGLVLGGCNNKLKEENEALKTEAAELREKVNSVDSEKAALATQTQQLQSQNAQLQSELASARQAPAAPGWNGDAGTGGGGRSGGTVREPRERMIEISSDVLFGSGSATLKPDARKELDKYMSRFKSASTIRIEGHTDSDPIKKSKWGSNQALSKARADAVKTYIVSRGVSSSKIDTVGKGASEPKGSKAASRRVDIVLAE